MERSDSTPSDHRRGGTGKGKGTSSVVGVGGQQLDCRQIRRWEERRHRQDKLPWAVAESKWMLGGRLSVTLI